MQYPGRSVQLHLEQRNGDLITLIQWEDDQHIRLQLSLTFGEMFKVLGIINTSFEGFERIVVEVAYQSSIIQVSKLSTISTIFEF